MSRVLVVGGGSELQPQLRRVHADVQTVVICRASALRNVHERHENRAMVVLNDDCATESWVRAARLIGAEWGIEAVASFADLDQDRAAVIAADLGCPFHSLETVRAVHDKLAMRARLNRSGLEAVPFSAVDSVDDLTRFCDSAGLPVIVKPSRGWASAGIGVVRDRSDMAWAYRRAAEADPPSFGRSAPMAERYYDGREFSVEAITHACEHRVFAITEKFSHEQTKVELGHLVPARLSTVEAALLAEHVAAALTVLGVASGPTHTEVILTAAGPVVVETHLRDAGDDIPRLVEDATGVNLAEIFLRQVLGADIGAFPQFRTRRDGPSYDAGAAIAFLAIDHCGILDRIDGWDVARGMAGVVDAEQLVPDGARLEGLTNSFARLGKIRVRASDAEQALTHAEAALSALKPRLSG
jgi:biotin carboxylase